MAEKDDTEHKTSYMAVGMALGMSLGMLFDNLVIGMLIGMLLGVIADSPVYPTKKNQKKWIICYKTPYYSSEFYGVLNL